MIFKTLKFYNLSKDLNNPKCFTGITKQVVCIVIRIMAPKRSNRSVPVPENPVDPAIVQILDLLRQQTANLTHQQQQLQQQQPPQPAIQTVTFKSFQAVNPPEFKGTSDPVVAQAWLKEMEKAFDLVGVEGEQKCKFASY